MSKLNWKLLMKKWPFVTQGLPPGKEDLAWVASTVTLIYGERDAVLVDTFLSVQHSQELADWLAESGKHLTTIYITHGHGDHFLGLKLQVPRCQSVRHGFYRSGDAKGNSAGLSKIVLGAVLPGPGSVGVGTSGSPRRRYPLPRG